jgi:hypothetical protein
VSLRNSLSLSSTLKMEVVSSSEIFFTIYEIMLAIPVATRLLGLRVRMPPWAWMFVSCTVFVLSGRGLCVGLITRQEESCRVWCVSECDREASIMRGPWPTGGCSAIWGGGERDYTVSLPRRP